MTVKIRKWSLALFLCLTLPQIVSGQMKTDHEPKLFVVAYSKKLFSGVNINDIQAALDLWITELQHTLSTKMKTNYRVQSLFIDDEKLFLNSSKKANIDIINIPALDFLKYGHKNHWTVKVFDSSDGIFPVPYLLLVNIKAGFTKLSGLRNKSIIIPAGEQEELIKIWLDKLTMEKEFCRAGRFFEKITPSTKPAKAALDLFFGKIDACVIGFNTFNTMAELNPQLKKILKIIRQSPPFLTTVTCINKKYDRKFIQTFTEVVLQLPKSPKGQQILALFGGKKIRIYDQPDLFHNEKALLGSYKKLITKVRK